MTELQLRAISFLELLRARPASGLWLEPTDNKSLVCRTADVFRSWLFCESVAEKE